jgi:fatty-acyl-CoA synthase
MAESANLINMGRILKQIALGFADKPALINIERDRRFSFGQLNGLSNRICYLLAEKFELGPGDCYATLLANDNMGLFHPWMFKSPATAVWIDLHESLAEKLSRIDYAAVRLVFMETALLDELYEPLHQRGITMVCLDPPKTAAADVLDFWELIGRADDADLSYEFAAADANQHISLLRFTGGTTGTAKCAMYTPANLWQWGCNPAHYYETLPYDSPRSMFFSPINHAASGSVVIPTIIKGGVVVTLNTADTEQIGDAVAREKVNLIYCVPTVLYRMLEMNLPQKYNLKSLKTIRYGAAPISPAKLERLLAEFGPIFVQGYGSTECWPSITTLGRKDHGTQDDAQIARLASVGRPVPGEEVMVCDENGRALAAGKKGEIYVRGANTIAGYYKAPELTAENFTPNGFWKSGDVGYLDEMGYLYLVERLKDMIITGGYNVYATEVENCLNSHAAVENAAVVGVPDEAWGEAVWSMVLLKKGAEVTDKDLINYCKAHLARYKAPKKIEFSDALPVSPAGKVLRRQVREQFQKQKME